jgi:hypothetical protein
MEMNRVESKVASDVDAFGWHVILVAASDRAPQFAYTIGLFHTYQHPAVVVIGLTDAKAHEVLNIISAAVKSGARYGAGDRVDGILVNYPSAFVVFPRSAYADYLGVARRFYAGDEFTALQFVWPDSSGRFPWEAGVAEGARATQVVQS